MAARSVTDIIPRIHMSPALSTHLSDSYFNPPSHFGRKIYTQSMREGVGAVHLMSENQRMRH